ncbi:MAG: hypothetical protein RSB96_01135 [Oscillospiraceae bacterium]
MVGYTEMTNLFKKKVDEFKRFLDLSLQIKDFQIDIFAQWVDKRQVIIDEIEQINHKIETTKKKLSSDQQQLIDGIFTLSVELAFVPKEWETIYLFLLEIKTIKVKISENEKRIMNLLENYKRNILMQMEEVNTKSQKIGYISSFNGSANTCGNLYDSKK